LVKVNHEYVVINIHDEPDDMALMRFNDPFDHSIFLKAKTNFPVVFELDVDGDGYVPVGAVLRSDFRKLKESDLNRDGVYLIGDL
jgi:hypothetical protein